MEKLKVKKIIIGKQFEDSVNYQKFIEIVYKNKIKVYIVEAGQKINIEKNLYIDVLWPSTNYVVKENVLNNNSLVCKLVYKNFSMLFTGDIEKVAEERIVQIYKSSYKLIATVLKVAHHGSKTSSIQEFLEAVNPRIVLIGVGKNNSFGHPNQGVIENFKNLRYKNL